MASSKYGSKGSPKKLLLTQDDTKVLGKNLKQRREKTVPPTKFKTNLYKTYNSNWTPMANKASNEQIYKERRELISNWFDLWTDSQRRRFLDLILRQCRRNQFGFIHNWFQERVPLRHLDFTTVLPRMLSLYIFSFLDPRSLCRASQVCWHWKFLTEQDQLWLPKCLKLGWFLPYHPEENEYGAWKRHYVACIKTLDMDVPAKDPSAMYGTLGDGASKKLRLKASKKALALHPDVSDEVLKTRPPWQGPDYKPKDLELARTAVKEGFNPNDPSLPPNYLKFYDRYGTPKKTARMSSKSGLVEYGLTTTNRKVKHRALMSKDDLDLEQQTRHQPLSYSMDLENFTERRMIELVRTDWKPPEKKKPVQTRPNLSGGPSYPLPWKHGSRQPISKSYPSQPHPRVIFISSRVPAAEVLVDAVNFGVIPIVYEYEGTTLDSLMSRLDQTLQGRNAQSVGMFVHSDLLGEMRVVHGATVDLNNLDTPEFVDFFMTITNHILPPDQGGHLDIFVPLAACEPGYEVLKQLNILTGMHLTCPTGITTGNYNNVNSEWLKSPEASPPPAQYFCSSKLNVWANTADQVQEAVKVTRSLISKHFDQLHYELVAQLTGQIIFDASGQADIQGVDEVTETLLQGMLALSNEQNSDEDTSHVKPLEFLGRYLLDRAGETAMDPVTFSQTRKRPTDTLAPAKTLSAKTLSQQLSLTEKFEESLQNSECTEEDTEVASFNSKTKDNKEADAEEIKDEVFEEEEIEEVIEEEYIDGEDVDDKKDAGNEKDPQHPQRPSIADSEQRVKDQMKKTLFEEPTLTSTWQDGMRTQTSQFLTKKKPAASEAPRELLSTRKYTVEQFDKEPDRRKMIAKEMVASETTYLRTLEIIRDVFCNPLKNSLASNRGIVSAHNLQIIFTDPMTLLDHSRELLEDLRDRVAEWNPQQCLGDIFVKFCGKLKPYVNFLNNYAVILRCIERCMEQTPAFRAFLKRHNRQPNTKMLTLQELLLAPTRRVKEYVTLLTWFKTYTPQDHADQDDLAQVLKTLSDLENLICDTKKRLEREKDLVQVQKKILGCPTLLEANRFLLKQLDVAHLQPPSDAVVPELRVYQHIQMLGLFMFNDALVVTRRTIKHQPFEKSHEYSYHFEACASLPRLRIEDIPDSKYAKNAFRMFTPRRSWVCSADTFEDKYNWMSLVEQTVRAALDDD